MKLITYAICQALGALATITCYVLVNLIASSMLTTAHVAQLTPACGLICLLLGLCSMIATIKASHRWAIGTIVRQDRAAQAHYERQHRFAASLVDCSHLFTGRDTVESAVQGINSRYTLDPAWVAEELDQVALDACFAEAAQEEHKAAAKVATVPLYQADEQNTRFEEWLAGLEIEEVHAKQPHRDGYLLMVPGPDCSMAYIDEGCTFQFLKPHEKQAFLS